MTTIVIIVGLIPTREGGGLKRGDRRKSLKLGEDSMYRTRTRRVMGHFNYTINC